MRRAEDDETPTAESPSRKIREEKTRRRKPTQRWLDTHYLKPNCKQKRARCTVSVPCGGESV
ncbi:hypothetical protein J6590_067673 [Homalodisca vitripennis]|nr:hypothetical protein J6590_067673 [Homalodisca vitripennis]